MIKYLNPAIGKAPLAQEVSRAQQYDNGKFINVVYTHSAGLEIFPKIMRTYMSRKVESAPTDSYLFEEANREVLNDSTVQLNWLGHAAVLIHFQGEYVLLDPMLGERASPFSFMGPKRYNPSPIQPEDLPPLKAVIISHDHYDHLDYPTIKKIKDKVDKFYVPLGIGASLRYWGVNDEQIVELDWWEKESIGPFQFTATPARHFSGRYLTRDNTLWASWVIEIGDKKIYFGGDSGIFDGFKEIGEKLGPFDLSLMPIGAYHDLWHDIHLNPEEAVEAFEMVDGGQFLPIHWGTFDLAPHSWYDPMERLVSINETKPIQLVTPKPGEWVPLENSQTDPYWWTRYSNEFSRKNESVNAE